MPGRYFNWKLAIVLVLSLIILGVSAFALRQWQRSGRAEEGLRLGNKAYEESDWEKATEYLGQYISVEQSDIEVLMKYADSHLKIRPLKSRNIQQAIGAYRNVLRADTENTQAARRLAEVYLMTNMLGEAELITKRQLDIAFDSELSRMHAIALARQRKFSEAADELKSLCLKYPDQILIYETLGQLCEQRPQEFTSPASFWFDEAVNKNPVSAIAYIVRAAYYHRNNDVTRALSDLQHAEKLDLSDHDTRLRLAEEFIKMNILDKAEEHLAAIEDIDKEKKQRLWQVRALLAFRSQSKEKMLDIAKAGLKELSSQPWDFMVIATELFLRAGEHDLASECITQLQQKDISPATVLFLQGLIAAEKGDSIAAVKCWRESMELGNKSEDIRLALASTLSNLGDKQSAIQQLRAIILEDADSYQGHLALAKLLAEVGYLSEAAEHALTAIRLSPDNPEPALLNLQIQMQISNVTSARRGELDSGSLDEIENQLSLVENSIGTNDEIKLLKVQLELKRGNLIEAQSLLDQLKQSSLSQLVISLAQVELLTAQDKIDEAISMLNGMIETNPQNIEPVITLAVILNRQNKRQECEAVIKEGMTRIEEPLNKRKICFLLSDYYGQWDQPDKNYELLKTISEELTEDILVLRRLIRCEQIINDPQQVQTIVDKIKSLEGEDGWQWRYEQARVWFIIDNFKENYPRIVSHLKDNILKNPNDQASRVLLARSYERAGESKLAISTYREALSRSPGDLRVIIPTVAALYNASEYNEAEEILNRASRLNFFNPDLSKLQLQRYLRHGQLDSASNVLEDLISNDPNNQAACLSLSLLKIQQNQFVEAEKLLAQLKDENPNSLSVAAAQVQLMIRQSKPSEALRICDEMVDNLKSGQAYILRARTYAMLGRNANAVEDFNTAAIEDPNNVEVWISRSDFYRAAEQFTQAREDIQKALSLAPDDVRVHKRAVYLILGSNEPGSLKEARKLLEEALEVSPDDTDLKLLDARSTLAEGTAPAIQEAESILQEIIKTHPEVSDAWVMLGEIPLRQGQPGRAIDAVLRGLAHRPNDVGLLRLKARAEALRSPISAIPTLKLLCELNPNDIGAATLLADTYISIDEPQKAVDFLKRHINIVDPQYQRDCTIALASAFYKNGNLQEAQKEFDSLLQSNPNDPNPLLAQIQLLIDDEQWSEIKTKITNWYQQHPGDIQPPISIARNLTAIENVNARRTAEEILRQVLQQNSNSYEAMSVLAILLEINGRSDESAEIYRRILEIRPDDLVAVNNLAWIMSEKQQRHQEALTLAQKGLERAPNYVDLIDTRGLVYFRLGEYSKALEDFERCIRLYPSGAPSGVTTRFHMAQTYAKLGQNGKAVEVLNEAMDMERRIGGLSGADLTEAQNLLIQLSKEGS